MPARSSALRPGLHPKQDYAFFVSFWQTDPDATTLNCFLDYLRNRRAKADILDGHNSPGLTPGTYVTATGTFEMVAPALQFAMVAAYNVSCPKCTYCSTLPLAQCSQDAFCTTTRGGRLSPAGCVDLPTPIGCGMRSDVGRTTTGCFSPPAAPLSTVMGALPGGWILEAALDPQGQCWWVECGSIPSGWTQAPSGSFCPGTNPSTTFCGTP